MNVHRYITSIVFVTVAMVGCKTSVSPLSKSEREAIVAAANQAIYAHRKRSTGEQGGMEIPKPLWGKAIEELHPLRVVNDKINVFIVMREDEMTEEGFSVSIPISSYAPGYDERFLMFKKLTQPDDQVSGGLYECKLEKLQPAR